MSNVENFFQENSAVTPVYSTTSNNSAETPYVYRNITSVPTVSTTLNKEMNTSLLTPTINPSMTPLINDNAMTPVPTTFNPPFSPMEVLNSAPVVDTTKKVSNEELYNMLLQHKADPQLVLVWRRGLEDKIIDPNDAIIQAIKAAKTPRYLLLIALALRYGASANGYVKEGSMNIHILAYVYYTILTPEVLRKETVTESQQRFLVNIITIMLLVSETNLQSPVFKPEPGKQLSISVEKWLADNGYVNLEGQRYNSNRTIILDDVRTDRLNAVAILLNKAEYIRGSLTENDYIIAVQSLSPMVNVIPFPKKCYNGDNEGLWYAFDNFYSEAFIITIEKCNCMPSYLLMAVMLSTALQYSAHGKKVGDEVVVQEITRMILATLARGYVVDTSEATAMSLLGPEFLAAVAKVYNKPSWVKSMEMSKNDIQKGVPLDILLLAYTLGVNGRMYEQFQLLSQDDPNVVISTLRNRQKQLMALRLAYPSDLVTGNLTITTTNDTPDIFDYGEYDLVYYRDQEGNIYSYTSTIFPMLLDNGLNPNTHQPLPQALLLEIKYKLAALHRTDNVFFTPLKISDAVKELRSDDNISKARGEAVSDKLLNNYLQKGSANGIPETVLNRIDSKKLNSILKVLGFQNIEFTEITPRYALLILAHVVARYSPEQINSYFAIVKNNCKSTCV
jgi:hypothetical protein